VEAVALLDEGVALYRELGSRSGVAAALRALGRAATGERAEALLRQSLAQRWRLGERPGMAECLDDLAWVAVRSGRRPDARRAARLMGAADALREATGAPVPPGEQPRRAASAQAAAAGMGRTASVSAWALGKQLTLDRAVAEALGYAPAEGSRTPSQRASSPLTAREREVAVLVARGLTSAQIAESLSISPRTVERHVANVLHRLGLTARTQLAAWVGQRQWLEELPPP
jgi:non-specific serine/threonine protein kinase